MPVTVSQIARESGFSKSMVSRALHNYPEISDKTKSLILDTASRLGYEYNDAVSLIGKSLSTLGKKDLRHKKNGFLNLVFYKTSRSAMTKNVYFSSLVSLIHGEMRKYGISILESYPGTPEEYLNVLKYTQTDGTLILSNTSIIEKELSPSLSMYSKSKPLIFLSSYIPGHDSSFHSVRADNIHAGYLAAEYLIKKGRKKICFIATETENPIFSDRYFGCLKAVEENSAVMLPKFVLPRQYSSAKTDIAGRLPLNDKEAGFVCASDSTAFLFEELFRKQKPNELRVLKDILLTGIDGCDEFNENDIRSATVKIDLEAMALQAAELFTKLLKTHEKNPQRILTGCRILENNSNKNRLYN